MGSDSEVTSHEIKAAFRAKVKSGYPDKSGTQATGNKFIQVNEAYAILIRCDGLVRHLSQSYYRKQTHGAPRHIATEMYSRTGMFCAEIIKISGKDEKEKVGRIMLNDLVYVRAGKKYTGEGKSSSGITASGGLVPIDENKPQISA